VIPLALSTPPEDRSLSAGARGGNAFFGKWPGDETDEELAAVLRDLS
jgi:hypothetical protein